MAEEKRVISWDYVSSLMNAVNQALIALQAGTDEKNPIFITNVEPLTAGKNVAISTNNGPNTGSVASILTDDTDLRVTIEWDRGFAAYQGSPTVNGTSVTNGITKSGGTYSGYVDLDITGETELVAELNGTTYSIDLTEDVPPTITDVTISTTYPNTQTSLKENDSIEITVTADKPFTEIVVADFELAKSKVINGYAPTTSKTFTVSVANRNLTTLTQQRIRLTVESNTGSLSDSFTSIDTAPVNNSVPSLAVTGITYPGTQSALKGSEVATINYTTTNVLDADDIVIDALEIEGTNQLLDDDAPTLTSGSGSVNVLRTDGDYNDNTNNLRFTCTFTENGATAQFGITVFIANVLPQINSLSTFVLRSTETPIAKTTGVGFTQQVKVTNASIGTDRGTLGFTSTGSNYVTSKLFTLSASDTDIHSNSEQQVAFSVENRSGMTTTLNKGYKIKGFAQKTIELTEPANIADLETQVVDPSKIIISGQINSPTPFTICQNYVADENAMDNVGDWSVTNKGDGANSYTNNNAIQVSILSELIDFGYTNGETLTINVEETV